MKKLALILVLSLSACGSSSVGLKVHDACGKMTHTIEFVDDNEAAQDFVLSTEITVVAIVISGPPASPNSRITITYVEGKCVCEQMGGE